MPLRRRYLPCLLAMLCSPLHAEPDMGWIDEDTMKTLPPALQREVPAHCGGIYYNPLFAVPPETRDTVITARETSLVEGGRAQLQGDVEIRQPQRRLRAEQATIDQATGDFSMTGNIRVEMPDLTFTAEELIGNTRRKQASLSGAEYALFNVHGRGSAETIEHAQDLTLITRGSYTTCPPDSDTWLISASDIELNHADGWGEARHLVLRTQGIPVIWIPWMTFPLDDRRKTGLLFPTVTSSDAGGIDITQPLYLNLHPQYDATLAPRHIHGRGNGIETEFRYLTRIGQGNIDYDWLEQDRLFQDESRARAEWSHDGNRERWFFHTDVNYVSDDYYLKDLDSGLEKSSTAHLPRLAEARYLGRDWQFLARVQSWQTIDPLLLEQDKPYRRLPQLQLSGDPDLVGPLYLEWLSDYTYFDRSADLPTDDVIGHRTHLAPALTMRLENSWGYIQPRARYYHTRYDLPEFGTLPDDAPTRDLWGYNLDAGLFFERMIADDTFVQTLEPRIFVNRINYLDQSNLPLFDSDELTPSYAALFRENRFTGYDRIGDEHSTTFALSSRFLNPQTGEETLRLRIAQKLYSAERRVQIQGATETDDTSPVISEASMQLSKDWHVEVFNHWNSSLDRRELNGARLSFQDGRDRLFNVGITDRPRDNILQGELAALVPVHNQWHLVGRWFYDMRGEQSLETLVGIEYRDCCWGVRMVSLRELSDQDGDGELDADTSWMFQLVLTGLGGFGGRIDSLLERSIPGYRRFND